MIIKHYIKPKIFVKSNKKNIDIKKASKFILQIIMKFILKGHIKNMQTSILFLPILYFLKDISF